MKRLAMGLAVLFGLPPAPLQATIITFEGRADSEAVTNQYIGQGVTFSGATALVAFISLNEVEFPPRSGVTVVFDAGGPISGNFTSAVTSVGGYFTYTAPLTLTAFAGPNGTGGSVGSVTSAFSMNTTSSGNAPNEFLHVDFAAGIQSFIVSGLSAGGSFVMDDFTFDSARASAVPEPTGVVLAGIAALGALGYRWRARRSESA